MTIPTLVNANVRFVSCLAPLCRAKPTMVGLGRLLTSLSFYWTAKELRVVTLPVELPIGA